MSISERPCPFERGFDTAFLMHCGATRPQRGSLALGVASPPRCHSYTSRPTITSAVYDALRVVWVDAGIGRAMCALPCTTRFGWCRWTPVLSAHEH